MAYPFRSPKVRPKKPYKAGRKGGNKKPSSEHIHGRRKTWLSLVEKTDGQRDLGSRLSFPWWKAPIMREARLSKAATLRGAHQHV